MKKILIVMAVAALVLALVACGGETATTTKGTATTNTPVVTTGAPTAETTVPTVETTVPTAETTATPETTVPATTAVPSEPTPVYDEINTLMETAWWSGTSRRSLQIAHHEDGTTGYVWGLTMSDVSMLPTLPEDHPTNPLQPTLQLSTAEGARCFIKDMNSDVDYKEYPVTNWMVQRNSDFWFEAEGFVPVPNAEYDMFIFFVAPEESACPGEYIYVWNLESPWSYIPNVVSGDPEIDSIIETAYQVQVHRHSQRYDIIYPSEKTPAYDFDASTFPVMNFSWTYASDNTFPHLDEGQKAWQFINTETGFVYIRVKGSEDEFVRYDIDYMLLARHCDMWFTLADFTPVENQQYEMYVFFTSGYGAAHPYALHYCYNDSWIAGPHE